MLLSWLFGRKTRLPNDRVSSTPRRARKAGRADAAAIVEAAHRLSALPGIADIASTKRLPRGFGAAMESFYRAVDAYHRHVSEVAGLADARRPGEPGGEGGCYAGPLGVSQAESLFAFRAARTRKDFRQVAEALARLGELQFKDIQAHNRSKNPEKMRAAGAAVRTGRLAYTRRKELCPFFDTGKERCRIWEARPVACRQLYMRSAPETFDPAQANYPKQADVVNIRLPVRAQVTLSQLDKRMALELSPLLYGGVLQALQLANGQIIPEVGEAPMRMQQDGHISAKANRNVAHAKKFQKQSKKKGKSARA